MNNQRDFTKIKDWLKRDNPKEKDGQVIKGSIAKFNGTVPDTNADALKTLEAYMPGDGATLSLVENGEKKSVRIEPGIRSQEEVKSWNIGMADIMKGLKLKIPPGEKYFVQKSINEIINKGNDGRPVWRVDEWTIEASGVAPNGQMITETITWTLLKIEKNAEKKEIVNNLGTAYTTYSWRIYQPD